MIIFGNDERAKVEELSNSLSQSVCKTYDEAHTYHDGKWVMFEPTDSSGFGDYIKLLSIKENLTVLRDDLIHEKQAVYYCL